MAMVGKAEAESWSSNRLVLALRQGFRHDHHRVQRKKLPAPPFKRCRIALGGDHDLRCGESYTTHFKIAIFNLRHRGVFVDDNSSSLKCICKTSHETRWLNRCTLWCEGCTVNVRHSKEALSLLRTQESERSGNASPLQIVKLAHSIADLGLIAHEGDRPCLDKVTRDRKFPDPVSEFIDHVGKLLGEESGRLGTEEGVQLAPGR
jgi:hypothetical protein